MYDEEFSFKIDEFITERQSVKPTETLSRAWSDSKGDIHEIWNDGPSLTRRFTNGVLNSVFDNPAVIQKDIERGIYNREWYRDGYPHRYGDKPAKIERIRLNDVSFSELREYWRDGSLVKLEDLHVEERLLMPNTVSRFSLD